MEVVSFLTFLEGKISELLFQIFFLSGIVFLLIFYDVDSSFIILSAVLFLSAQISFLWFSFQKKQKDSQRIINLADELQESYYISDILPKPGDPQNKAYYYALKKACKAMNDKISQIEKEKQEYEEYVESFAHEIKRNRQTLSPYRTDALLCAKRKYRKRLFCKKTELRRSHTQRHFKVPP